MMLTNISNKLDSMQDFDNLNNDSLSANTQSNNYFSGLDENRISKIVAIIFSIIGSFLSIGMLYSIIWYGKFGSDSKRILINRLFVSFWLCPMIWEATGQQVDIVRYIFGPLPKVVCRINYFIKLQLTFHALLLLDFIAITRYIFIFWLKNPSAFNDEFWSVFINLWTFVIVSILQYIQISLPGKNYTDIWICSGENPNLDPNPSYKSVAPNNAIKILSLLIHMVISIRIKYYKWKTDVNEATHDKKSKTFWIFSLKTDSVVDVTESILPFILFSIGLMLNLPRSTMSLEKLNQYPDCLSEYFYTLVRPSLVLMTAGSFKLIRDKQFRTILSKEIRNTFCQQNQILCHS